MTIQDEWEAATELLVNAYKNLKKLDSEHELLRFVENNETDQMILLKDQNLRKEFEERFPSTNPNNEEIKGTIYALIKYHRAIGDAINDTKRNQQ